MRTYNVFSVDKVSGLMWSNILQFWKIMMIYAPFFPMSIFYRGYISSKSKYINKHVKKHSKDFPIVLPAQQNHTGHISLF